MPADEDLLRRARLVQAGELEPVTPRAAATVALLRDGPAGPEVYLLRRVPQMAFAAGMYVFPGGSVDATDAVGGHSWQGPDPATWARRLRTRESTSSSIVRAAVRETFEETGVLLASRDSMAAPMGGSIEDEVVGERVDDMVDEVVGERERAGLEAGRESLAALLVRHDLTLRADLLAPLQHWITPELEPRRYDTWFFVAVLPPGQEPRDVGGEADRRAWITPQRALDSGLTLMAPTRAALTELARYVTVVEALTAERQIDTVMPGFEIVEDRVVLIRP
ncbi:NUDIX hydrolase [Kineosporia mesophila]|uniref:NUDIX hydrolase n=1 Tax=Kineosporia mesophila TaxID=566012 RepID=UPI0031F08C96